MTSATATARLGRDGAVITETDESVTGEISAVGAGICIGSGLAGAKGSDRYPQVVQKASPLSWLPQLVQKLIATPFEQSGPSLQSSQIWHAARRPGQFGITGIRCCTGCALTRGRVGKLHSAKALTATGAALVRTNVPAAQASSVHTLRGVERRCRPRHRPTLSGRQDAQVHDLPGRHETFRGPARCPRGLTHAEQ